MPELPEVEHFRQLLLPLISEKDKLLVSVTMDLAPRKFLSESEVVSLDDNYFVSNVLRRGKLICMELEAGRQQNQVMKEKQYVYLHMGMTGRISTPGNVLKLESLSDKDTYPPPWTCLEFQAGSVRASFSDPRKFGSITLSDEFKVKTAPDALEVSLTCPQRVIGELANQSTCIKAILLDQNRVLSGIGNWIADEVCFQCRIHPQQSNLTTDEATLLLEKLHVILKTAIDCLESHQEYPKFWLFHYRWNKKRQKLTTDSEDRFISFIKAAGRTTVIVPSLQKLAKRKANMVSTRDRPPTVAIKKATKKRKQAEPPAKTATSNVRRSTRCKRTQKDYSS